MKTRHNTPLRVVQITDTHLRARPGTRLWGVDVDKSLSMVLQQIQEQHWATDLVLATGDLVHDEAEPAYRRLRLYLESLGLPVFCLPGNHDTPAALETSFNNGLIRHQRHVVTGNWQFILLNSVLLDSEGGYLDANELFILDHILTTHPTLPAMICLHHQPLNIGSAWLDTMTVENGEALFAIVDRHPQVRALVWGHIHQEFAAQYRDIQLLGAPSTCVQFKPGVEPKADDLAPGYRWFELYRDGTLVTGVERIDAEQPVYAVRQAASGKW